MRSTSLRISGRSSHRKIEGTRKRFEKDPAGFMASGFFCAHLEQVGPWSAMNDNACPFESGPVRVISGLIPSFRFGIGGFFFGLPQDLLGFP